VQVETTIHLLDNNDVREQLEDVDPAEMWEILRKKFNSTVSEVREMKLAIEFYGLHPEKDEKVFTYCAHLIRYRKPLHRNEEEITDSQSSL
jgi:hypothetical protein